MPVRPRTTERETLHGGCPTGRCACGPRSASMTHMLGTTARTKGAPRRVSHRDREAARRSAASANAEMNLRPIGQGALVVVAVALLTLVAATFVPRGTAFGGPLQGDRLDASATLTVQRKTKGKPVTFGLPIPWNAGRETVVLEDVAPIGAEGIELVGAAAVPVGAPPVETQRGYPPDAAVLSAIDGFAVRPGSSVVDGFQIVVGLRGDGIVPAFALVYRVGEVRRVAIVGHGILLCAASCEDREASSERQRRAVAALAVVVDAPDR
jgi:hypothetical protein